MFRNTLQVILIILLLTILTNQTYSQDSNIKWELLPFKTEGDESVYYINFEESNNDFNSDKLYQVWVKVVPDNYHLIQTQNYLKNFISDYSKYAYSTMLMSFNCSENTFALIYNAEYSNKNQKLYEKFYDEVEAQYIRPNTIMNSIKEKFCK
jgi:hypothetical protein